jgi:hypothetical protein
MSVTQWGGNQIHIPEILPLTITSPAITRDAQRHAAWLQPCFMGSQEMKRGLQLSVALVVALKVLFGVVESKGSDVPRVESRNVIAILRDNLPGHDLDGVDAVVAQLRKSGFEVAELTASQVCSPKVLTADRYFLYVIPFCRSYPAAGFEPLLAFAQNRGLVLFLGGPFLDDPVWRMKNEWLNRDDLAELKQNVPRKHYLFEGDSKDVTTWTRTCNEPAIRGDWIVIAEGPDGQPCFRFSTENLTGWDGYLSPAVPTLFGSGHDLFTFQAKGAAETVQVAVEVQEKDGSRWIAVADIRSTWQRFALDLDDFQFWPDSPTRGRRGTAGDRLRPSEARRVGFQLAQSHTTDVAQGKHTFWIAGVGTCRNPVAGMELKGPGSTVSLESIYPRYKVHSPSGQLALKMARQQAVISDVSDMTAEDVICSVPRTTGAGFGRDQKCRSLTPLTRRGVIVAVRRGYYLIALARRPAVFWLHWDQTTLDRMLRRIG